MISLDRLGSGRGLIAVDLLRSVGGDGCTYRPLAALYR